MKRIELVKYYMGKMKIEGLGWQSVGEDGLWSLVKPP